MKYLVTLLFSVFCAVSLYGQIWVENFNSGFPSGWLRYNIDNLTPSSLTSFVNNAWVIRAKQTPQQTL